jgi:YggT family protein
MSGQILVFIDGFLTIYSGILFVTALISWMPSLRGSAISQMLYVLTEPYVNLFRGGRFSRLGNFDISFLWAVVFVQFLQYAVNMVVHHGRLDVLSLLHYLLQDLYGLVNFFLAVLTILIIVRLIMYKSTSSSAQNVNFTLDYILNPMTSWWRKFLHKSTLIPQKTLLVHVMLLLIGAMALWAVLFQVILFLLGLIFGRIMR